MAYTVTKFGDHRERRNYAKTKNAIQLGNLLEIQKKSYPVAHPFRHRLYIIVPEKYSSVL